MPLQSFRVGRCKETIELPVWTLGHLPTPLYFGCVSQTTDIIICTIQHSFGGLTGNSLKYTERLPKMTIVPSLRERV